MTYFYIYFIILCNRTQFFLYFNIFVESVTNFSSHNKRKAEIIQLSFIKYYLTTTQIDSFLLRRHELVVHYVWLAQMSIGMLLALLLVQILAVRYRL